MINFNASKRGTTQLAVLLDPDKVNLSALQDTIDISAESKVDYFLVGGSLLVNDSLENVIQYIKKSCSIPVVLFPGSPLQISKNADAILLLSLISGRNPELLIGHHVLAAPKLRASGLEIVPTGYILIDGGRETSVSYMSGSQPIPSDKEDIVLATALAGEMLGHQLIYLDAGSGAHIPVSDRIIKKLKKELKTPVAVGGGINSPERAKAACDAGADLIVIGNAAEKNVNIIKEIALVTKKSKNETVGNFQP